MAFYPRFARPAQILLGNRDPLERIAPVDVHVRAEDVAILEGKRIERPAKLISGKNERCRDVLSLPPRNEPCAGFEIGKPEGIDEGEARQRRVAGAVDIRPVRHDRTKSIREDLLEVERERVGGLPPRLHVPIVRPVVSLPCTERPGLRRHDFR